ncbi:MAG: hypothetical protein LBD27_07310 [Tannerella sp.]|jgi:hypothetical protein|nr:hypothetical protein [Tannerella sp.]
MDTERIIKSLRTVKSLIDRRKTGATGFVEATVTGVVACLHAKDILSVRGNRNGNMYK